MQMKQQQLRAISIFVVSASVLSTLLGVTLAQTKSAPLDALSSSNWGVGVYLYNPATDSIVSPTGSDNGLTMTPWQYYDNTTMQWTITLYAGAASSYAISAVSPQAAGCAAGATASWNALKKSAVTILCSPSTSVYTNFALVTTALVNTFNIVPKSNAAACLTVVNDVPTSPATACNPLGQYTQWQLVSIFP